MVVMKMARKAYTLLASQKQRRLQSLTVTWILNTSHWSRGMPDETSDFEDAFRNIP